MKTEEDWAREIEADLSTRVIARKGQGGVMTVSELWALAQTLGRQMAASLYDAFGVDIHVEPTGDFTVYTHNYMHAPFQSGRGCLAPQTAPRVGEAGYHRAVEEPPLPPCPQCARPNPIVDEGSVRCWWCGHQAQTIEQYREGP